MRMFQPLTLNRPRLLEHSGIVYAPLPHLILVVGLPGSGKSVLFDQLIQATSLPTGSIHLRRRSPIDSTALFPALQQLGRSTTEVVEAVGRITTPTVLAIDDLHHVFDDDGVPLLAAQPWLSEILDNPALTVIATTQIFPDLPIIARLAANGCLAIVDAQALAFSKAECVSLWNLHHNTPLSAVEVESLWATTGGWAAPVGLACRQGWPTDPTLLSMLLDDVVERLSPFQRRQLYAITPLDTFSLAQLAALSDVRNAERLLNEWQYLGFLQTATPPTLQPLLHSALRRTLQADPAAYHATLLAIATWHAEQGDFETVASLAHQTQHWPMLMHILAQYSATLHASAHYAAVIRWLNNVPMTAFSAGVGSLLVRCHNSLNDREGALLQLNRLLGFITDADEQRTLHLLKANIYQASGDIAAADALVVPYLEDTRLTAEDRARALRLHGIALASQGAEEAALDCLARAAGMLEDQGPNRLVGLVLGDYANIAARVGRYLLAERLLRRTERVWRDLSTPPPPDLANTLNMQAVVALHMGRVDEADRLARQAYVHAMAANRSRAVAGTLATQGDIALAQQQWELAATRYEIASEHMHGAGDLALLPYVLALHMQAARHTNDSATLSALLRQTEVTSSRSPLDRAWLAAGKAAAYLQLGIDGSDTLLERALATLGDHLTLAHGVLMLLLAEAHWQQRNLAAAQQTWAKLDQLLLDGRGGIPVMLSAMASHLPALLHEAHFRWHSPFAGSLVGTTTLAPRPTAPLLKLRVLGQVRVAWQGEEVKKMPHNGILLLTLLLLAEGSGMTADELRLRLWGSDGGSSDGWRKLLERVRKALAQHSIILEGSSYRLGIPLDAIDADVLLVRHTPLFTPDVSALRAAADYATQPLLPGSDEAWVLGEREILARRGAELWFAVGNLDRDEHSLDAAAHAYATALRLNPLYERAVVAAMTLALDRGQRSEAITIYHAYNQHLIEAMGLDPGSEIAALYHRALDP